MKYIIIYILFTSTIFSKDKENLLYYEEALKTEKISSVLSIPLYEEFLKNNPSNKYSSAVISRLYELYYNTNRIDDLIILSESYELDKSKKKSYLSLLTKIASSIGISLDVFSSIAKLLIKTDDESNQKLINIYLKNTNNMLLNYIFAVKLKKGEYQFIEDLFNQGLEINPILKIINKIKLNSQDLKNDINLLVQNDIDYDIKKEIFFLYGVYLTKNKRFKEGIRYFKMSNSHSKTDKFGNHPKSVLEISKSYYIKGFHEKACDIIENKKFIIQTESDDFMRIFCDTELKNELGKIKTALKIASLKENNLVMKRYLNDL